MDIFSWRLNRYVKDYIEGGVRKNNRNSNATEEVCVPILEEQFGLHPVSMAEGCPVFQKGRKHSCQKSDDPAKTLDFFPGHGIMQICYEYAMLDYAVTSFCSQHFIHAFGVAALQETLAKSSEVCCAFVDVYSKFR